MITLTDYPETYTHRAAGWIQDASSFSNLHRFVAAFSHASPYRMTLLDKIQRLVPHELARHFLKVLEGTPISPAYEDIVGSAPAGSRKSNTVCNGIGQAALDGQKREYQGDWPTNNFLRWAEALQLITYAPSTDTYTITKAGEMYVRAEDTKTQQGIIKRQLSMYPPALRVLTLLEQAAMHTKFSLGEQLGFVGEKGFTNISEKLFVDMYFAADSGEERQKLKSDYEGSSDKYARQICSWLITLGLAVTTSKPFERGKEALQLRAYAITPQGREFVRKANVTGHRYIPFGMLSMEDSNKEFICKRRAVVLKALADGPVSTSEILRTASNYSVAITAADVRDDVASLGKMGLRIEESAPERYSLKDKIVGLQIPRRIAAAMPSETLAVKETLRRELTHIDHQLLVLIDFAYGSARTSRLFETYVARVYQQLYSATFLLGGARKPDVVVCTDSCVIIIDTKAYSKGFPLPQAERDKMVRYIEEYKQKTCRWRQQIEQAITADHPAFQFVSSEFGSVGNKLADIATRTGVNGSAVTAEQLLRLVDYALATGAGIATAKLLSNEQIRTTA